MKRKRSSTVINSIFILSVTFNILNVMAQPVSNTKAENDTLILKDVRAFLQALNSGGGKPLEELSPADARQVLIGAQQSVLAIIQASKNLKRSSHRWYLSKDPYY